MYATCLAYLYLKYIPDPENTRCTDYI